jgi:hypothetical protein
MAIRLGSMELYGNRYGQHLRTCSIVFKFGSQRRKPSRLVGADAPFAVVRTPEGERRFKSVAVERQRDEAMPGDSAKNPCRHGFHERGFSQTSSRVRGLHGQTPFPASWC